MRVHCDILDDGSDATNAEDNFGSIDSGDVEKPAMTVVRTLSKMTNGDQAVGVVPVSFSSLHARSLDGARDRRVDLSSDATGSVTRSRFPTAPSRSRISRRTDRDRGQGHP